MQSSFALPEYGGDKQRRAFHWYEAKEFDYFWKMYNHLMLHTNDSLFNWCSRAPTFPLKSGKSIGVSKLSSRAKRKLKNRKRNRRKEKKRRDLSEGRMTTSCRSSSKNSVFILSDDDNLQVKLNEQMVLSGTTHSDVEEEFLDFLKQSVTHRIKWNMTKALKKEQDKAQSNENLNIIQEENPDAIRERELQRLYGDEAAKIQGMETAMQLSFDRISTFHQPTVWPNIPLKFAF